MTEEKRTIHVLKDEKLGVDREYVAVDRNAEVGEKIIVTFSRDFPEGFIANVKELDDNYDDGSCYLDRTHRCEDYLDGTLEEYHVLEPTDIVHIDGERYRLEDRKAEGGEKVMYVNNESGESDGVVAEVSDVGLSSVDVIAYEDYDGDTVCGFSHDAYRVLTPVKDEAEPKESDVITVLANLGAEVAELKRKNDQFEQALGWNEMGPGYIPELRNGLSELKSVVDNYESEIGRLQAEINALHEDKVRLGGQLAKVAAVDPKAMSLTADELAQLIVSLKKAGL